MFQIIKSLQESIQIFNTVNICKLEDYELSRSDYHSFLIFFTNILNGYFNTIKKEYEEHEGSIGEPTKILISRILELLLFLCKETSLYIELRDYYQTPQKVRFTIYSHYLLFWALSCNIIPSNCNLLGGALSDMVKESQDLKEEEYIFKLDEKATERIYNFCCSELCKPYFEELIGYCSQQEGKSHSYAKNYSWDTFTNNLLTELVESLDDNLIILPMRFDDGMDAETAYNFRIFINKKMKTRYIYTKDQIDAIILIISAHELCRIARIRLMNDHKYFGNQLTETKHLSSGEEIGYYLEENYVFFKYLQTLNLFNIDKEDAKFLLDEANWTSDKFKARFNVDTRPNQDTFNVHRMKRGASHARHTSYHKAQVQFQELKKKNIIR